MAASDNSNKSEPDDTGLGKRVSKLEQNLAIVTNALLTSMKGWDHGHWSPQELQRIVDTYKRE